MLGADYFTNVVVGVTLLGVVEICAAGEAAKCPSLASESLRVERILYTSWLLLIIIVPVLQYNYRPSAVGRELTV